MGLRIGCETAKIDRACSALRVRPRKLMQLHIAYKIAQTDFLVLAI